MVDRDAIELAARVEAFVRETIVPYEQDQRRDDHGPLESLVAEMRDKARGAGLLTPHIRADGSHLDQRATAHVLRASGLSLLGPLALNTAAPDEGNMLLLGKVATPPQQARFLDPIIAGDARSAFLMTEPALEGGAGSDPSMLQTKAMQQGDDWIISGRKAFATGFVGAKIAILMARTDDGSGRIATTMFLVDLPNPAIMVDRIPHTIDSSMPDGHAILTIDGLRVPSGNILGEAHAGLAYAQVRLSPARLSHCMRWHGAAIRANEIATRYACTRQAFGKTLIDHEGVGFMLADNLIDLKQVELMVDWCAGVLDDGSVGVAESSMTKVAVSEALMRVADRCVQIMGGIGVTRDTIVEQLFREIRAFRIYDGPTEVHKYSLARKIKREQWVNACA